MYKRAQSTHKLPVHSAKGFANFSASLAMLPPTCLDLMWGVVFTACVVSSFLSFFLLLLTPSKQQALRKIPRV
jgi:hypothetical protein